MNGFTESEPTLSSACCARPNPLSCPLINIRVHNYIRHRYLSILNCLMSCLILLFLRFKCSAFTPECLVLYPVKLENCQ